MIDWTEVAAWALPWSAEPALKRKRPWTTPTKLTLARLRREGALATVVERYNAHARRRVDLFGIGDVLAVEVGRPGALLVQATNTAHQAERYEKCQQEPNAARWCAAGNRLEIWGWVLSWSVKPRRQLWTLTRTPVIAFVTAAPAAATPARGRSRPSARAGPSSAGAAGDPAPAAAR